MHSFQIDLLRENLYLSRISQDPSSPEHVRGESGERLTSFSLFWVQFEGCPNLDDISRIGTLIRRIQRRMPLVFSRITGHGAYDACSKEFMRPLTFLVNP